MYWLDSVLDIESKIANLGPKAFVKEDIFGFDIKVQRLLGTIILYAAANIHQY